MSQYLSQREAASQWSLGRATIQRAIKSGKLSLTTDKCIDPAEMFRVFGEPRPAQVPQSEPLNTTPDTHSLKIELAGLKAENAGLKATLDASRETIDALKQSLVLLSHESPKKRHWWQR